jgi:predicted transcriptional regulator of viral defense system
MRAGIQIHNRSLLERLHRSTKGPFTIDEAARVWSLPLPRARRLVVYLSTRGWLSRVRHGLYVVVPLGAANPSAWREEPWIVATTAFSPCFIGGWSACEHWSLTEQMFRVVQVHTARPIRARDIEIQGTPFRLKHVPIEQHFGLKIVWHGQVKSQVSDPSRTVIDILDSPKLGGGIRHVADVLAVYFGGEHRNDALLVEYADRLGNRTVFKRLGFLLEHLQIGNADLISTCRQRVSEGISSLDPSAPRVGAITKRWNLRINAKLPRQESPS